MKRLFLLFTFCGILGLSVFAQPENLYIIGGPFNSNRGGNWLFRDIVQLEKDTENPNIFYYRGYIGYNTFGDERGNFKILNSDNSWNGYHPDGDVNQLIGAAQVGTLLSIREGGPDTKWEIPADRTADGYYEIKVDTENNTFLIEKFTAASCPDIPVGLFIIGGPFVADDLNWGNVTDVAKMKRDDTSPYVFHYKAYMERNQWGTDPGNFKILINKRDWEQELRPGGDENVDFTSFPINEAVTIRNKVDGGPDKKWFLPEDGSGNGYWDFTIDAKNLKLTVNEFTHDFDYFDEVYITGAAMPSGWTADKPEVMTKVSKGVYSWTGVIKAGDFKFLKRKNYFGGSYVATTENEAVSLGQANTIVYEKNYSKHDSGKDYKFVVSEGDADKKVTITLDLTAKTMTIKDFTTGIINKEGDMAVNISASMGKILISGAEESYVAQIFNIDGKRVTQKTFEKSTEIALPQGCYIISLSNKSGIVTNTKVVLF